MSSDQGRVFKACTDSITASQPSAYWTAEMKTRVSHAVSTLIQLAQVGGLGASEREIGAIHVVSVSNPRRAGFPLGRVRVLARSLGATSARSRRAWRSPLSSRADARLARS